MKEQEKVTISSLAAEKLSEYLVQGDDKGLRLQVKGGGCSGFNYRLSIDSQQESDLTFFSQGYTIIVDTISYSFLKGAVISYRDEPDYQGFNITNSSSKEECGCGQKFLAED